MKIDHVELFVPSRWEAAEWYRKVLGFEVIQEHVDWAEAGGPLMISNDGGNTMLALFKGQPQGDAEVRGLRRVAFRVDASGFLRFLESSASWSPQPLGPSNLQDHDKALSLYFSDPYGNLLEVTTYEYAEAKSALPF